MLVYANIEFFYDGFRLFCVSCLKCTFLELCWCLLKDVISIVFVIVESFSLERVVCAGSC